MSKKMMNAVVLVAVLTVAVLAPSMTFAAPATQVSKVSAHTGTTLLDMILSMFGFNPVSGSRTTPTQAPVRSISGGTGTSTEGAIWGGKCPYGC